jgi:hypothetical protein
VKVNLSKTNKDVDEVKVMMSQMLEKINVLERMNKLPSPTDELLNNLKEDILVAGGYCLSVKTGKVLKFIPGRKTVGLKRHE